MNLLFRWVLPPLGLLLLALAVSLVADGLGGPSTREIAEELRHSADLLRPRIDACLSTRSAIELRFEEHVRRTRSLGDSIEGLESLDPRGVPVDHYEVYLSLVEQYNRATLDWEGLAGELREFEPRCRELIGAHNALVDSMALLFPGAADQELLRLPADMGVPGDGAPGAPGVPEAPGAPGTDAIP